MSEDVVGHTQDFIELPLHKTERNGPIIKFDLPKKVVSLEKNTFGYVGKIYGENGFEVDCLIDTGARFSSIPIIYKKHFNCVDLNIKIKLLSYNNSEVTNSGFFLVYAYLPPIGQIQIRTIFTEDKLQPILGLEFLKNYEASLLYSSKYQQHFLTLPLPTIHFKLLSDVVLPAKQTIFATIICETESQIYTNSLYILEENKNTMSTLTTVKTIEADHDDFCTRVELSLPFVNSSDKPIILNELLLVGERFSDVANCESHEIFNIVPSSGNTTTINVISTQDTDTITDTDTSTVYTSLTSGSHPSTDGVYSYDYTNTDNTYTDTHTDTDTSTVYTSLTSGSHPSTDRVYSYDYTDTEHTCTDKSFIDENCLVNEYMNSCTDEYVVTVENESHPCHNVSYTPNNTYDSPSVNIYNDYMNTCRVNRSFGREQNPPQATRNIPTHLNSVRQTKMIDENIPLGIDLHPHTAPVLDRRSLITKQLKEKELPKLVEDICLKNWNCFSAHAYDCGETTETLSLDFDHNFYKNLKAYPLDHEKAIFLKET